MLHIEPTGHPPITTLHVGCIADVIAATLPKEVTSRHFRAEDFSYGFAVTSPKDIKSLGEGIVVNGICYTTSTDSTSPDYFKVIHGPNFVTGGVFLIPQGAEASHKASGLFTKQPISLLELYNSLYEKIKQPVAFVGLVEFDSIRGAIIGHPPTGGKNIFENKEFYYPHPDIIEKKRHAFVIGVINNYHHSAHKTLDEQLKGILYYNPNDISAEVTYHAHALILKQSVETISKIEPTVVDQVIHLFTEGSFVTGCDLQIFTINNLKAY